MIACHRIGKPLPTVVRSSKEESTTLRRLKRTIVAMTKFTAARRKEIDEVEDELEGR